MWAPVDITAVPTANELFEAKLAIEQVESELKDALLEHPQLRVGNLEKNLKERRAWIAPIRRLSYDVLSLIFELCGEDNWKTPLRISGVSRWWRNVVLATPRAWAFLRVGECTDEDEDSIHHFFQHSGQQPLHVFLRRSQRSALLSGVAGRLECLSIENGDHIEKEQCFLKLERLLIRSLNDRIAITDLNISQFPALRELICEPTITKGTVTLSSSMKVTFPPPQILSVTIEESNAWLDLLMGCRSSLVSLRLHVVKEVPASELEVLLPVLRCLEIHLWDHRPDIWLLDMKTPAIEAYIEDTEWGTPSTGTAPIHGNVENVARTRLFYAPNLSAMPSLRTLQVKFSVRFNYVLSQLQANRSLCPRLELIELMQLGDLVPYETRLVEVNRGRSQPISIRTVRTWTTAFPYEISRSLCGPDMPCSRG